MNKKNFSQFNNSILEISSNSNKLYNEFVTKYDIIFNEKFYFLANSLKKDIEVLFTGLTMLKSLRIKLKSDSDNFFFRAPYMGLYYQYGCNIDLDRLICVDDRLYYSYSSYAGKKEIDLGELRSDKRIDQNKLNTILSALNLLYEINSYIRDIEYKDYFKTNNKINVKMSLKNIQLSSDTYDNMSLTLTQFLFMDIPYVRPMKHFEMINDFESNYDVIINYFDKEYDDIKTKFNFFTNKCNPFNSAANTQRTYNKLLQ